MGAGHFVLGLCLLAIVLGFATGRMSARRRESEERLDLDSEAAPGFPRARDFVETPASEWAKLEGKRDGR